MKEPVSRIFSVSYKKTNNPSTAFKVLTDKAGRKCNKQVNGVLKPNQ